MGAVGSAGKHQGRPRHQAYSVSAVVVGLATLAVLTGCGSTGNSGSGPAVISKTTDAPDTGQAGTDRVGDIVVPKGSYVREKNAASLRLDISNNGATADKLVRVSSNISGAGTVSPDPMPIPAHSTVHVGPGANRILLPVTGGLDPGETFAVTLTFAKSGQLLVYALTSS